MEELTYTNIFMIVLKLWSTSVFHSDRQLHKFMYHYITLQEYNNKKYNRPF